MPRNDLTETQIRTLQRRAGMVVEDSYVWQLTKREAEETRRALGELLELRARESHVKHMEGQEQEW